MERLKGIGASGGLGIGPALVVIQRTQVVRIPVAPDRAPLERQALDEARTRSQAQLADIRDRMAASRGRDLAAIFDAQILLLDDPLLVGRAGDIIDTQRVNAEWAVQRALEELADLFDGIADPYLRERKGDLLDVAGRLRMNLRQGHTAPHDLFRAFGAPFVLVADELVPSVIAQLDWDQIRGVATDGGSRTHHTAILARSLGVPAVVGLGDITQRVPPGAILLIDGDAGAVTINPDAAARQHAESRLRIATPLRARPGTYSGPATTCDGVRVVLQANIERSADVDGALALGAEGIGLYRSEFLLGGRPPDSLDEAEQYAEYRRIVERMAPRPVTIRIFDIDERQHDTRSADTAGATPWATPRTRTTHGGLRGIRFALTHPDLLRTQLRALVRASAHGAVRILLPFVTSVSEVRAARLLLAGVRHDLSARDVTTGTVSLGVMVEVPSAAITASLLAPEVEFFTIGSNDLIQYTLAADRTDERVAGCYEPLHPAVLRLLRLVVRAGRRHEVPVALCGEMAADPILLPLLVGCGLREFSMTPGALPAARQAVEETNAADMARLAARALTLPTPEAILQVLREGLDRPSLYTTVHHE